MKNQYNKTTPKPNLILITLITFVLILFIKIKFSYLHIPQIHRSSTYLHDFAMIFGLCWEKCFFIFMFSLVT